MIKLIVQSLRGCFKTCDPNILGIQSIKSMKNIEPLNSLTRLDKNTKSAEKKSAKEKHIFFCFSRWIRKKFKSLLFQFSHYFVPINSPQSIPWFCENDEYWCEHFLMVVGLQRILKIFENISIVQNPSFQALSLSIHVIQSKWISINLT